MEAMRVGLRGDTFHLFLDKGVGAGQNEEVRA